MSRRNKILLVVGLLTVILVLLLLWFLRGGATANPQPVTTPPQASVTPSAPAVSEEAQQAAVEQKVKNAGVETVAKLFVERYGSYSTEAQFQNVRDILPLATVTYAAQLQAQIDAATTPDEYYGVTTIVLSVTVDQMDEVAGTAHATVSAQRDEAKGSPQNSAIRYQKMDLTFAKEGGEWKVASSTWE